MIAVATVEDTSFKRDMLKTVPSLRAFAVSLCGHQDLADDLVQDTIMKAWAKQDSFAAGTNIKAWLFTILRNEFYSQMRKSGREIQDSDNVFTERLSTHPAQYGAMDLRDFREALNKLPSDQREAIILVGASGFSYEEAAEICHCAIGTIKSRIARARGKLQELLDITGETEFGPDANSASVVSRAFVSRPG
ncbi:MAG: RNA polymerase subunit sigma [Martelella sp.]|nr:RNA polymerase subunit sigma [Martelella sp.]